MDKIKLYIPSALWIIGFQLVSGAIGAVTRNNIPGWYEGLVKSPLTPPNFVFPIVWTILYVMIALAGWLSYKNRDKPNGALIFGIFVFYVILNWGWSFVFFALQLICTGLYWIIALCLVNAFFIFKSWSHNRAAALLMTPLLLWSLFAAYLNYAISVLN